MTDDECIKILTDTFVLNDIRIPQALRTMKAIYYATISDKISFEEFKGGMLRELEGLRESWGYVSESEK